MHINRAGMAAVTERACNPNEEEIELRRGPWTLEEDNLLIHYISNHGEGHWNLLAKCSGLKRTGKSCRLRWLNYLKPDIKRGNLTPQEQLLILELHSKWGNRWSKIAQNLPGRTDNEIKNYWRTRVQKQARQLNIESNSKTFLDAVRCFWIPTMIQKMEQTSSSTSPSYLPTTTTANSQDCAYPSSLSSNYSVPSVSNLTSPPCKGEDMFDNHSINRNSSSVTSPCFVSQIPQTSENPKSSNHAFDNTFHSSSPSLNDSYYVESSSHGMEGLNLDKFSAIGAYENPQFDCQMGANDWMMDNMIDTLWSMEGM